MNDKDKLEVALSEAAHESLNTADTRDIKPIWTSARSVIALLRHIRDMEAALTASKAREEKAQAMYTAAQKCWADDKSTNQRLLDLACGKLNEAEARIHSLETQVCPGCDALIESNKRAAMLLEATRRAIEGTNTPCEIIRFRAELEAAIEATAPAITEWLACKSAKDEV